MIDQEINLLEILQEIFQENSDAIKENFPKSNYDYLTCSPIDLPNGIFPIELFTQNNGDDTPSFLSKDLDGSSLQGSKKPNLYSSVPINLDYINFRYNKNNIEIFETTGPLLVISKVLDFFNRPFNMPPPLSSEVSNIINALLNKYEAYLKSTGQKLNDAIKTAELSAQEKKQIIKQSLKALETLKNLLSYSVLKLICYLVAKQQLALLKLSEKINQTDENNLLNQIASFDSSATDPYSKLEELTLSLLSINGFPKEAAIFIFENLQSAFRFKCQVFKPQKKFSRTIKQLIFDFAYFLVFLGCIAKIILAAGFAIPFMAASVVLAANIATIIIATALIGWAAVVAIYRCVKYGKPLSINDAINIIFVIIGVAFVSLNILTAGIGFFLCVTAGGFLALIKAVFGLISTLTQKSSDAIVINPVAKLMGNTSVLYAESLDVVGEKNKLNDFVENSSRVQFSTTNDVDHKSGDKKTNSTASNSFVENDNNQDNPKIVFSNESSLKNITFDDITTGAN